MSIGDDQHYRKEGHCHHGKEESVSLRIDDINVIKVPKYRRG